MIHSRWLQSHEWSVLLHPAIFKISTGGRQSIPKPQALAHCSTCLKSDDYVWFKAGCNLQRLWEFKPCCSPVPQDTKQQHLIRNSLLGLLCMMLGLCKPLHHSPKEKYRWTGKKNTFLRPKHPAEDTSMGKGNIRCKRSLQHVLWGSHSASREGRETDRFPFRKDAMVLCSVFSIPMLWAANRNP